MATIAELEAARDAARTLESQIRAEYDALATEQQAVNARITAADLTTDAATLAADQARKGVLDRALAEKHGQLERARAACEQAHATTQQSEQQALAAVASLKRLVTLDPADLETEAMSIGTWRYWYKEHLATTRRLLGPDLFPELTDAARLFVR